MSTMTLEQKRIRDWYYRIAVTKLHEMFMATVKDRNTKDKFVYLDVLLSACEKDADICAEVIEMNSDKLRYINHRSDKKGKLVGFDVVWSDSEEWKKARNDYHMKKKASKDATD